jgi:ABC-type transporter Mla subunit MlaD
MADHPTQPPAEHLTDAARETVAAGVDIRERVHDLTLQALKDRRFDRHGIQDVIRAVTQGVALGADRDRVDMGHAISEALSGLDKALRASAEAGQTALKELASTGRNFSDSELKQALGNLRKLEEDFFSTVGQVADAASEQVRPELRDALAAARRSGTETGRQVASVMSEFAHRFSVASLDATVSGLEMASEFGTRFAELASGVLSGLADALRTQEREGDEPPKTERTP